MNGKGIIGVATLAVTILASTATATTTQVVGKIRRTLVADAGNFGGCMVLMDKDLSREGLNCEGWVTFSCSGELATAEDGARLFDSALMAFALNRTLSITITDEKKINGQCYGRRVDVWDR